MSTMKLTIREAFDNDILEELCAIKGWNFYIVNEGLANMNERRRQRALSTEVELTDVETRMLVLKSGRDRHITARLRSV